jgi:glycosyltransferase involved in cell wall biosynthesis
MRSTVCLNMIVKNETRVIRRCLDSVKPMIDHWVIVDTGSTDGTQALVRDVLRDIPGELHERPWVNFGHNRSEAIALAEGKTDAILLTDADMVLRVHDPSWRPDPRYDGYYVRQYLPGRHFSNVRLVNGRYSGDKRWCYRCATHEYIDSVRSELNNKIEHTDAVSFLDFADGGSKADKYERDARMLETERARLEAEAATLDQTPSGRPGLDPFELNRKLRQRNQFYLAQTYRDAEQFARAIDAYRTRAAMGGWDEEVWYALYQIARLSEMIGVDDESVRAAYLAAFEARPTRAEPLVRLAAFERVRGHYARAHLYARYASDFPMSQDLLFIGHDEYRWLRFDETAVAAFWLGRYEDCAQLCEQLLALPDLPETARERIAKNLHLARQRLAPVHGETLHQKTA